VAEGVECLLSKLMALSLIHSTAKKKKKKERKKQELQLGMVVHTSPIIPACGWVRQENGEFEASLGYNSEILLKKPNK
jgi:hypothetical protein